MAAPLSIGEQQVCQPQRGGRATTDHRSKRWHTKFGMFVRAFGVNHLATKLQIEPAAIYQWIRGRTVPKPPNALTIVMLSKEAAVSLTLEDIYAQRDLHADQN